MEKESVRSAERREERPVGSTGTRMQVRKRNGSLEPVDLNKIVLSIQRPSEGLPRVDAMRVATRTVSGLYDGATTRELDQLSIQTAASLVTEEPEYGKLAARLLSTYVDKEVRNQDIMSFSQSIARGKDVGLIGERVAKFVADNARKLNDAVDPERTRLFEYFGLRTLYDRYLLKHPERRDVLETPQYFFLRIACALSENVAEAIDLYRLFSTLEYLPSSPTLFNSGTRHEQLSSCFLLDSPEDDLGAIYKRYADVAMLSKFSGGIGLAYHRVRSRGSLIREHERPEQRHRAVAQDARQLRRGGEPGRQAQGRLLRLPRDLARRHRGVPRAPRQHRRRGAPHAQPQPRQLGPRPVHEARRGRRGLDAVRSQARAPTSPTCSARLRDAPTATKAEAGHGEPHAVKARELYGRMMRTLAQTGNGWMTFKDKPATARATRRRCRPSCTSRTSAPRSSRSPPGRDGGLQPRLDQPRSPPP
jgi:ribonucleoside-diphosphate reductase alpha chain